MKQELKKKSAQRRQKKRALLIPDDELSDVKATKQKDN